MIVVTGGAGFIGSVLVWRLNRSGRDDIVVVDRPGRSEKWKNLVGLRYADFYDKEDFIRRLESDYFGDGIDTLFHLGACSSTTEADADYLIQNNYEYSVRIGLWREKHKNTRLIYASSAATYGGGENGYKDNEDSLHLLRPLNMYGYSKHMFDLYALRKGWLSDVAGLKYFNVYGPNEYHKNEMRSVVNKAYPQVMDKGKMELFKSYRKEYGDGEQRRDFLYVKDAVEMTMFFFERPDVSGIFNIGTGVERTWNDVGKALFQACEKPVNIKYVPMPENLIDRYQYRTCADIGKLRMSGYKKDCTSMEKAVEEYVKLFLGKSAYIADYS